MTYAEKFEEIIKTVFPGADIEEIVCKCCPQFFFENAGDKCSGYCTDCWNRESEEDDNE